MPSDDFYAKYLTPPPPSAAPSGGDDPYSKYLTPPGASTAAPVKASPIGGASDPTTWALAGLDSLGMGLGTKNPFMAMPDQLKQDVSQAHENLGWMDYPLSAAAYAVGPGKILGPAGKLIGGAGGMVGSMAAEGGLAGAASSAIADPTDPWGIARGAAGGAALGGAAGGLTKGVNAASTKFLGSPASIDPAAAVAATRKAEDGIYSQMRQVPIHPDHVDQTIGGVMSNLDPSVETGMSGGLKSQINDIRQTLQEQGTLGNPVNANQVNSWQRQVNDAASRNRFPTDGIVAKQISDGLDGVLQANGAGDLNAVAKTASQQRIMAENLAEWQRKTAAGAPIGQAPLTEAETYYQNQPDKYGPLVQLYQTAGDHGVGSWLPAHIAGAGLAAIGGAVGGWPLAFMGEMGGLALKPAIAKGMKKWGQATTQKAIQQLYPGLTGQQLTGASQGPQVGELIKNLMLGTAY